MTESRFYIEGHREKAGTSQLLERLSAERAALLNRLAHVTAARMEQLDPANLPADIAAILAIVSGIAGGANWNTYGPRNVEIGNIVTPGITVYDPGGGIIPQADITEGTYEIDRVRGAALASIVPVTPSSKADGLVFAGYDFPAADWQVGDIFVVTFSGVAIDISGTVTNLPPVQLYGRVVREPDIQGTVNDIDTNLGTVAAAPTAADLSDVAATSAHAKLRRTLINLLLPALDSADNNTPADVIGNKTDTRAGNSIVSRLVTPSPDSADAAYMRDVVGNKSDGASAAGTASIVALLRTLIAGVDLTAAQETALLNAIGTRAAPGDQMDLLAATILAIRDILLSDSTAFPGANVDVQISTRATEDGGRLQNVEGAVGATEGATALHNKLTAARSALLDRLALIAAGGAGELNAARAAALQRLIDDLTAARAGYLDELAAANMPADVDGVIAGLYGAVGIVAWLSRAKPADGVSVSEVVRDISELKPEWSAPVSATHTTTGTTEETVFTTAVTTPGAVHLEITLRNMVAGDDFIFRVYKRTDGANYDLAYERQYVGVPVQKAVSISDRFNDSTTQFRLTVQRNSGTNRAFPYVYRRLSQPVV